MFHYAPPRSKRNRDVQLHRNTALRLRSSPGLVSFINFLGSTGIDKFEMMKFLLSRGASTDLPDDEPRATPLAWAERRNHAEIVSVLRQHRTDR